MYTDLLQYEELRRIIRAKHEGLKEFTESLRDVTFPVAALPKVVSVIFIPPPPHHEGLKEFTESLRDVTKWSVLYLFPPPSQSPT